MLHSCLPARQVVQHDVLKRMSFWDKFKFTKKPFREPKQEPALPAGRSGVRKQADSATASPAGSSVATESREHTGDAYRILVRPLVTEKTARLASRGQYGFVVSPDANRIQIAAAVEAVYGIRPVSVNVSSQAGKEVRFGQKLGRRRHTKKAFVTLPPGKKISVYEGV